MTRGYGTPDGPLATVTHHELFAAPTDAEREDAGMCECGHDADGMHYFRDGAYGRCFAWKCECTQFVLAEPAHLTADMDQDIWPTGEDED